MDKKTKCRFGDDIKCYRCGEIKNKHLFLKTKGIYRTCCKKCHSEREHMRRNSKSEDEKKEMYKKSYNFQKQKRIKGALGDLPLSEQINMWIYHTLNRNDKKEFLERKNLSKDILIQKCLKAKEVYPNIIFCFVKNMNLNRAMIASLDKIIPSKGYTDENTQIIPLWLNSAKLDSTQEELDNNILLYIESDKKLFKKLFDKNKKNI